MARILLIDDDLDILRIGSRLLLDLNHDVVTFEDGNLALEYLQKHSFDIVITDANMPVISGFEVLKRVKSNPNWRHMVVALLTARNSSEDVIQAAELGVDDYFVKPIDPLLFMEKVKSLVEKIQYREYPEFLIRPGQNEAHAYLQNEIQLISVSELGVVILTPFKIYEGDILKIGGHLFSELRVDVPALKVISVKASPVDKERWIAKTIYLAVKDNFLSKIRTWLQKQMDQELKNTGS